MAGKAQKLASQRIADRIARLEAEQREALEKEDREADALLLRLARRSHLRSRFIAEARSAITRRGPVDDAGQGPAPGDTDGL